MQCDVTTATYVFLCHNSGRRPELHELDCSATFTLLKSLRTMYAGVIRNVLERALIFLRLRLSLRERFFFHFSLIL